LSSFEVVWYSEESCLPERSNSQENNLSKVETTLDLYIFFDFCYIIFYAYKQHAWFCYTKLEYHGFIFN